jgi:hypothetical protein
MYTCTTHPGRGEAAGEPGLGAELRESLLLLSVSIAVTAAVTVTAQAAAALLG